MSFTGPFGKTDTPRKELSYVPSNPNHPPETAIRMGQMLRELTGHSEVQCLMRMVPQNASAETIDMTSHLHASDVYGAVGSAKGYPPKDWDGSGDSFRIMIRPVRILLLGFFESLFYYALQLPEHWWFENQTRIDKLLYVSLTLESMNLCSFDGNPVPEDTDIPSLLVGVTYVLKVYRNEVFPKMLENHKKICKEFIPEYASIYTSTRLSDSK